MNSFTVFDAFNESRGEVYLGLTDHPLTDFVAKVGAAFPAPIRHWKPGDKVVCRELASGVPLEALEHALAPYIEKLGYSGSRIILDPAWASVLGR